MGFNHFDPHNELHYEFLLLICRYFYYDSRWVIKNLKIANFQHSTFGDLKKKVKSKNYHENFNKNVSIVPAIAIDMLNNV